eukprot:1769895-Amphidinium_carterae.1
MAGLMQLLLLPVFDPFAKFHVVDHISYSNSIWHWCVAGQYLQESRCAGLLSLLQHCVHGACSDYCRIAFLTPAATCSTVWTTNVAASTV